MIKRLGLISRRVGLIMVAFCLASPFCVVQALTLDDISHAVLPGERVRLKISVSESMQDQPFSFAIDNPARIVLDFPNTSLGSVNRSQPIDVGVVNSVSTVEVDGRTRVVINLTEPIVYDVDIQDKIVLVTLGGNNNIASDSGSGMSDFTDPIATNEHTGENKMSEEDDVGMSNVAGSQASAARIEDVDFKRGDEGEGRVVVTLSDPSVSVDMRQVGKNIVLNFIDVALPDALDRKLDVVDFATPVKEIDSKNDDKGTEISLVTTTADYDHLAYQLGNTFIVEVRPLDQNEKNAKKTQSAFTGERLSLNFQDIEVRAILQLIADFTGFNMVASDTVTGSETLRLKNVPWDQALDIILKAKGLGLRKEGNVIMVAPNAEISAREKLELEAAKQVEELAPLRTEFIQVNYAKAGDLASLMKADENSLLSGRGSVAIDERTNTLIVQDVSTSLESIRELLAKLDIPVRQVLIESRIVNADESFTKDLGVRFGYAKRKVSGGDPPFILFGGSKEGFIEFGDDGQTGIQTNDQENLLVDLAAANADAAAATLLIGKIGSYLLQLELSALIAEGRGEDIASPKIITANQRQARIESGVEIPYQEASASGATSTAFKQAVLSLDVTPQITPDDRVILDLSVSQDTPGAAVIGGIPIDTNRLQTQVLVDDGETVVLGGVYTKTSSNSVQKVPFFADLPYVGFLFKRSAIRDTKSELLIFVTPKILKDDSAI